MSAKPSRSGAGDDSLRVTLDGETVAVPPERRSINAIRCYLETLALEQQRVLFTFTVEGESLKSPATTGKDARCLLVEGRTTDLADMPLRLIETALQQTVDARKSAEAAIPVVLINSGRAAQELWWDLTHKLKDPLLTLSLLPEGLFGQVEGAASPIQLRRWQLQQLARIIRDVDTACGAPDPVELSNMLENRVLPWLQALEQSITFLHGTTLAGQRAAATRRKTSKPVSS